MKNNRLDTYVIGPTIDCNSLWAYHMLFDAQFTKDNWAYYIWPEDADMGEK